MKIDAQIKGSTGKINILDTISENTNSNSKLIRDIIDDFIKNKVIEVEVYLNSGGGSVFEASEIVNQLKRVDSVIIVVGSLAASAATYIMANFKNKAHKNSQFMIHRPSISTSGDTKKMKSDLKLLENITEDYKNAYATKMNKTLDEVEEIFEKGDYWLTASQAKEEGLLDEIIVDEKPNASFESPIDKAPNFSPKVTASNVLDRHKKNDIIKSLIFNKHNVNTFDRLGPSDRLEILYGFFDTLERRQDKETFFIDIVDNEDREKANEWMSEFSVDERKDFKDFYPFYYSIFTQKPQK